MATDDAFLEGQRWRFRTATGTGVLVIGRIERKWLRRTTVHVSIEAPIAVAHMPFTEAALRSSVVELLPERAAAAPSFDAGLAMWRQDRGAAFEVSVATATEGVAHSVNRADRFDALVTEMRASKSEAMIGQLYDRVFALPQWFFLGRPEEPRAPVVWTFPGGMNPAPCILAFTDRDKARRCAIDKGLVAPSGEPVVMPAPVREAVPWLLSGPGAEGVTWICFNLGPSSMNFPLYLDEAKARLDAGLPRPNP